VCVERATIACRDAVGQTGVGLLADGNHNNLVDFDADSDLHTHVGQTVGGGLGASANATVPEPAMMVMLNVTAAGM
jgi:hypothetical protein